jgi:uncharacterized protein (TIGR02265 family)
MAKDGDSMVDDQAALQRRRSMATAKDLSSGVVFQGVLELVKQRAGAPAAEQLKKDRRVPKTTVAMLKYPSERFLDLIDGAVDALRTVQKKPDNELLEDIGASTVEPWAKSPLGVVLISLNAGNVHRTFGMIPTAFSVTHTFSNLNYEQLSERSAKVAFNGWLLGPAYALGIFKVTLRLVCKIEADIQILDLKRDGCDFTLMHRW